MQMTNGSASSLPLVALVVALLALGLSGWNFYVLGSWTSYWLADDIPAITACETYFDAADATVVQKAQALGVPMEEGILPAYPDVFFSNNIGACVALYTFYDDADVPTDYGNNLETGAELSAEEVETVFSELLSLYEGA